MKWSDPELSNNESDANMNFKSMLKSISKGRRYRRTAWGNGDTLAHEPASNPRFAGDFIDGVYRRSLIGTSILYGFTKADIAAEDWAVTA